MKVIRSGLMLLVVMLMAIAVSVATPAPASAHAGHSCGGVTGSGFSCGRGGSDSSTNSIRSVSTYYNGSLRTLSILYFGLNNLLTDVTVCDRRAGDNITPLLQVEFLASGDVLDFSSPGDLGTCRSYGANGDFRANLVDSYRVVTYSSGDFSHATVWCHSCVPG